MESLAVIIGLFFLLFLFGGALCGWLAIREMGALRRKIRALENRPAARSEPVAPKADKTKAPAKTPAIAAAQAAPTRSMPAPRSRPERKSKPKPKSKPKQSIDLETLLGAKGSVWIGGLALLLGAVFLLRYTMEAGLLNPLTRVSLAGLLGLIALGLSEWLARRDLKTPIGQALSARADIPALLAAVGIFSLFGAVYAAHALYGLLGTLPAFIGMAVVALGAMMLSLRRGPWLAAVGLIGALVVPLLVASVTPSFIGVFAYVGLITVAALWVARRQGWDWLVGAAAIGATVWLSILSGKAVDGLQFGLWTVGLAGAMALTLRQLGQNSRSKWSLFGWLGVTAITLIGMTAAYVYMPYSMVIPFALSASLIVFSVTGDATYRWPALIICAIFFPVVIGWFVLLDYLGLLWMVIVGTVTISVAIALASLKLGNGLANSRGSSALVFVAGGLSLASLTMMVDELVNHSANIEGLAAFSLAGLFAVATWAQPRPSVARGAAWVATLAWVVGASQLPELWQSSLILCFGIAFTIALALRRDDLWVRLTPLAMAGVAGLVASAALDDSAAYIVTTPFLNELWLYFGLPGALTAAGAFLLRRKREDLASQGLLGGAIVFTLLLIVLLIHHAMNAGDLTAQVGFEALAVQLLVLFAALFGASWMRGGLTDWPSKGAEPWRYIVPGIAMVISMSSLAAFALGQGLEFNPLLTASTVVDGHPVFNALLLAYLAPAILLSLSALRFAGARPVWFVRLLGALAVMSWLLWTTAQIRRVAQGEVIAMNRVSWANGELYAVSAVWLLTGLALLLAGVKTGCRDLRLASAILITLTTLKVFLIDMRALDGAFRAVSFIGLGIALIGIGRLYQRVLSQSPDTLPS